MGLRQIYKNAIQNLPSGSIVNVPIIESMLGRTYGINHGTPVNRSSNAAKGRTLSSIAKEGLLIADSISNDYNGEPTTIHNWKKV